MAILTRVPEPDLRDFAGAYELGPMRSAEGVEAGTVNTSYALDLERGKYFLRIYEEQGFEGAEAEARLLFHLAASGVPTPPPVRGGDGALVRGIAGKPGALFPWIEGDILCQKRVTVDAARDVGAALARVHLAGPPPGAPLGAGRFGPTDLAERCDRVAQSDDPEARGLADSLRAAVLDIASKRRGDLPSGLVHGDLFRDNVLWQGDAVGSLGIAALLDFESAHHGPFAYDVAVTILSWCYGSAFDFQTARAVVRGYLSVRDLEEAERASFFDEAILATLRFTITRITDNAIRVGKRWQRFAERREALERMGRSAVREALDL